MQLVFNSLHPMRMRMTNTYYGMATIQIKVLNAIFIPYIRALGPGNCYIV